MTPDKTRRDTLRIAEEAAEWLETLAEGGAQTRADFVSWLRASPRHVEELLIMRALDDEAERIDPDRHLKVEKLLREIGANVVELPAKPSPARARPSKRAENFLLKVAGVAVLAIALSLVWLATRQQTYTTAIGEQRAVELEDGSIVHLNAQSRVAVLLSKQTREVQLLDGEALFKVARDPGRPFRVHAGDTVIRAVGTQFNVYRRAESTTVSVLEGRVEISRAVPHAVAPGQLAAGETALITSEGEITRATLEAAESTAWRQRRLIFRDSTLVDIAAEFNRYNRTLQIKVEGEALRSRRYGGTFDADDPQSLVDFLRPDKNVEITRTSSALIIRPRQ